MLLTWVGGVFFTIMLLIVGIRMLGSGHDNLALHLLGPDSERSPQACWYGICPGQTTISQAVDSLTNFSYRNGDSITYQPTIASGGYSITYNACVEFLKPTWRSCIRPSADFAGTRVEIDVSPMDELSNPGIRLGDVVAILGNPRSQYMCAGLVPDIISGQEGLLVVLSYENGSVVSAYRYSKFISSTNPIPSDEWVVSPNMRVASIDYPQVTTDPGRPNNEESFPWRGFERVQNAQDFSCGN